MSTTQNNNNIITETIIEVPTYILRLKVKNAKYGYRNTDENAIDSETKKVVSWDESIIDNEFLGKKKTKKCCVYCAKKYDNLFQPTF